MARTRDETAWVLSQHFLRTFCEEAEASKTPGLRGGRSKDESIVTTGPPGLRQKQAWAQEPQESSWWCEKGTQGNYLGGEERMRVLDRAGEQWEQNHGGEEGLGQGEPQVFGPGWSVGDDVGEVSGDQILMNVVCRFIAQSIRGDNSNSSHLLRASP